MTVATGKQLLNFIVADVKKRKKKKRLKKPSDEYDYDFLDENVTPQKVAAIFNLFPFP